MVLDFSSQRAALSIGVVAFLTVALCSSVTWGRAITDLRTPQSFVLDPKGDQYFISNANGPPDMEDNNGFISKLDREGKIIHLRFIQGGHAGAVLHAPKGMAVANRTLYVTDIDTVRAFDTQTGETLEAVPSTRFRSSSLTDIVYDGNGHLYVSDTEGNAIYRIDIRHGHTVSLLVQDAILAQPRGLAIHPTTHHLIVASWEDGTILEVADDGSVSELVSNSWLSGRFYNLDGIDFDRFGNLYISDFTAGKVWRMQPNRDFRVIAEFLPYPADIGIDPEKHVILVPYFSADAAEINGLERPVSAKQEKKRTLADYGLNFDDAKEADTEKDE